ncbi:MAG: insulinase family protein [Rikenellaceae bacterium]|jgi:predicted Zn-dependent peptidase|nr:insulinase family protein [Rikenellaceae bacterium]
MIEYKKTTLSNGLTVIAHRDNSTPMAAVNVLYKVGARNEHPDHTGFAHLFEHLMFGGSIHIAEYDTPVQLAAGENNAFTNNDYTDYYITLPKENIETAFWLESDRMLQLAFNEKSLEVQRKVVVEEFNQRYLNQPYGDLWLLLRPLIYRVHPYRWATIGIAPEHITQATMAEVKAFYRRYYNPDNAILSVAADMEHEQVFDLAQKWFGDIPRGEAFHDDIPAEPEQTEARRLEVTRAVPATVVMIVFRIGARLSSEFVVCDVISDLLSNGNSSRLYQRLVKERGLFSGVNAYVTGDIDPGLFVVTGHLLSGVSTDQAEEALWGELDALKTDDIADEELEKVRNKYESGVIFGEINGMNKAMNLGFYEMLGDIDLINREVDVFRAITREDIRREAEQLFVPEKSNTLIYRSEHESR